MTPAENPKAKERNFVFVLDVKKASKLPIPVAKPAIKVKVNAINTFSVIRYSSFPN